MSHTQLAVLDTALSQWQFLRDAIPDGIDVLTIEPGEDGLAALVRELAARAPVHTLHILSHGHEGAFHLGTAYVDDSALHARADTFAAIRASLAPGADILLYSCEVARGAGGRFLEALAAATGAHIAASQTLTGAAARGGDWNLDWTHGHVATAGLRLHDYPGVLAPEPLPTLDRIIDTVGNRQGDLADGDTTDDTRLALAGTGEAGDTVEIYDGSTLLGTVTVGANGRWLFHTDWLEDGQYDFRAKYEGGIDYSESYAITVDAPFPLAPQTPGIWSKSVGAYQNAWAFAALKADGSVVAWGSHGGNTANVAANLAGGVVQIFSNQQAFAALKVDGSLVTWGNNGGNSASVAEHLASGVVQVFSTTWAFAALKANGSVVTWGSTNHGANSSSVAEHLTSGVVQVVSNSSAFAALKADGSVITWGNPDQGGDSDSVVDDLASGVMQIVSNGSAFAALKADGSVVAWGNPDQGGDSTSAAAQLTSGVVQIFATSTAFAALKTDGSVVAWGSTSSGGNTAGVAAQLTSGVVQIFNNGPAFAALKVDGSVITWGNPGQGGNSASVAAQLTSGVVQIFNTFDAFAALKADGSVVTWGSTNNGGNSASVAEHLAGGVVQIFATQTAFAALKADGSVITWGTPGNGGDSAGVADDLASGVVQIFATQNAFAALKADGSVVIWGNTSNGGSNNTGADLTGIVAIASPYGDAISLDPNPDLAYTVEDNAGDITGPLTDGDTTDDTTPTFSGTAPPEAYVSLYANDALVGSIRADANGQWTYTPAEDLGDGEHAFHVLVFDAQGTYIGVSPVVTITVDGPPDAPTVTLAEDTGIDDTDGITTNPTMLVGDLKADATWEYRIDGGEWIAGSGTSFELDEGEYAAGQIEVRQTTAGGQTSPVGSNAAPIVVDLTGPDVPDGVALPEGGLTNDNTVTVDLPLEPGATWQYSLNGGQTWHDGEDDRFTLPDGEYAAGDIQVRQVDAAGNPGQPAVTTDAVTIDTVPPAAPTITTPELTNAVLPLIAGTAEPGSTVILSIGGAAYSATADAQGEWSVDLATEPDVGTTDLNANGANPIDVTAIDAAGNVSIAGGQTLVIDTTPPAVPSGVALPDGGPTNDNTVTVNLSTLEPDATWQYSLDGGQSWQAGDGSSFTVPDGDYPAGGIQVRQVDAAGNPGQPAMTTQAVTIDTVPPEAPTVSSPALTNTTLPVIAGTAEPDSTVIVSVGGAIYTVTANAESAWSVDLAATAPDDGTGPLALNPNGDNPISVTASDAAGNVSIAGGQTLVIDTTPPAVPAGVGLPDGGPTNDNTVTVDLSALEPGATWEYSLDNGQTWQAGDGSSFTVPDDEYPAGDIQVRQVDAAGNPGQPAATTDAVTIDTVPPEAPTITSPELTNAALPVIAGTAEPGSDVILSIGGAAYTVTANAEGAWSVDLATADPDGGTGPLALDANGDNPISVTASDAAGNASIAGAQTLVIDTTPPAVPSAVALPDGGPTNDNTVTVDLSTLEPDATWEYSLDGGQTWDEGSGSSFTVPDGDYPTGGIQVRQVDAAGNPSQPAATTDAVTIDTVPPAEPTITTPELTNAALPVVAGTAEADSTVVVSVGGATYTVTANAEGDWSVDLATADPDIGSGPLALDANGDNPISVTASDAAGNASTAGTQTLVIDTTPPAVPTGVGLPDDGPTNDNIVTVDLSALEPDATWEYSLDGGQTWDEGSGSSFTVPDGDYPAGAIQVRQVDAAGNPGQPAATTDAVTIDTVPPEAPTVSSPALTNATLPVIAGTAEPDSTVVLSIGGAAYTVTADAEGDWSVDLATADPDIGSGPLDLDTDGENAISVTATDPAGNASTAGTQTLVIDTTPPAVPAGVGLPTGGPTNDNTVTVDLSALEEDATWEYSTDGGSTWIPGEGNSFTLDDGGYAAEAIQVRQVDAAGNPGAPASTEATVIIDTVPPTEPAIDSPDLTNVILPVISGTAEAGSTVVVAVGGATYTVTADAEGNWSVDLATADPDIGSGPLDLDTDGENAISVTATDPAGNTSDAGTQTLVIDTTPPGIPAGVALPDGGPTNDNTVTVDLSALEPGATWEYSLDGGQTWGEASGSSFTVPDGDYPAGAIQVRQVDAAGNPGQPAMTMQAVTVDTVPPEAPMVSSPALTNATLPVIAGTAEPDSTVVLSIGGAAYTVTADAEGAWSVDLAVAGPDDGTGPLDLNANGENPISVTATDAAGNESTAGGQSLVIDTTAPAAPSVAFALGGGVWLATVTGLEDGATWQYKLAADADWTTGSGTGFTLPLAAYAAGQVQVRQLDAAGNAGAHAANPAALVPPTTDDDGDGIPDNIENLVPGIDGGQQGDGNGDGIPDVEQADVSSLPWAQTPDGQVRYVTLANDAGLTQQAVSTQVLELDDLPAGLALPVGALAFTVADVPASGLVNFSVFIDSDIPVNGYYKLVDGHWVNIATAITDVGGKWRIDFSIEDGGVFDADGLKNGVIVDPGAPGFFDGNPLDLDGDQVPDLLEFALGLTPGIKDNDVFERDDLFVMQLYRDVHGREADAGGLAYWQGLLADDAASRTNVALAILGSGEAQEGLMGVMSLLQGLQAEGDLAHWREVWNAQEGSVADFAEAIAEDKYGNATDDAYVAALYQDVLGRAADTEGQAYWVEQLGAGLTRGEVALALLGSDEFRDAHAGQDALAPIYAGLLGRAGDDDGLAYWSGLLAEGATEAGVVLAFIGSAEYHNRFLPADDLTG